MIGVAASPNDWDIVREFFELFKTPWEPAVPGRAYPVVLSTGAPPAGGARLTVIYGSRSLPIDEKLGVLAAPCGAPRRVALGGSEATLYGPSCQFSASPAAHGADVSMSGLSYTRRLDGGVYERFGFDLFAEIQHLLTVGQPASEAASPALDLHIEHLRLCLRNHGTTFVEVPPRPAGHSFVCCLTHDIDFEGIRRHGLDRTLAGFLARATVGTCRDVMSGRRTGEEGLRNVASAASLPFVYAGLIADPWRPFETYVQRDAPRPSTFFVVPRRDHAGVAPTGEVRPGRAVRYEAHDVAQQLTRTTDAGHEIALHGLDAWRTTAAAVEERQRIETATSTPVSGVRMHWLYFEDQSPARLDAAGFEYDSTCGYNETVGFKAGTSQAFLPPGCSTLLELPLHVMDTALFYPDRLGLDQGEGLARCLPIVEHAERSGGAVVVNWHDRSLVPERQWNRAYDGLLRDLDERRPWYATALAATSWFRRRRTVTFDWNSDGSIQARLPHGETTVPAVAVELSRPSGQSRTTLDPGQTLTVSF